MLSSTSWGCIASPSSHSHYYACCLGVHPLELPGLTLQLHLQAFLQLMHRAPVESVARPPSGEPREYAGSFALGDARQLQLRCLKVCPIRLGRACSAQLRNSLLETFQERYPFPLSIVYFFFIFAHGTSNFDRCRSSRNGLAKAGGSGASFFTRSITKTPSGL